jgi:ligand-binding sensor domain-containing protein
VLSSLLFLSFFAGVAPRMRAADERATHHTVPQASVDPRPIRLPIVDGTDLRFARLSTTGGLFESNVGQVVQDEQGFIWFGTPYGLDRFDGYSLKFFAHDPRNPKSLSGEYITALFRDRDGTLWVGCHQFLNKFERATETFTRYPIPFVSQISQDAAGMLWLATRAGLYGLDTQTRRIQHYTHNPIDLLSLSSNDIKSTDEDKEGRFWVANTEGLDEFDRRTGKVTLHIAVHEPSSGLSFYEDRFGTFWIYHVSSNVLEAFDRKTNTLTHYLLQEQERSGSAFTGITAMIEDQNGTLWLGTHGAGLLNSTAIIGDLSVIAIILLTLTASPRTQWNTCSLIGKGVFGRAWAGWGSPALPRGLCRSRHSFIIPAVRIV